MRGGSQLFLERVGEAGGSFSLLQSNLLGQVGTTSVMDTNLADANAFFYRIGVP